MYLYCFKLKTGGGDGWPVVLVGGGGRCGGDGWPVVLVGGEVWR